MKKAIGYARISTKDQSHFSTPGQTELIQNRCARENWELLGMFVDDGHSAKSFDRPDWQKLEIYIRENHRNVDYLLVAKYDRFSRNLLEALQAMERIEKQYGIVIISVMEPIGLHPDSPYYFKQRTDFLLNAQTELLVIRDRTKFGIHHATKNGRHVNRASFGYINQRDERDMAIIVPDETKVPIIRLIYREFLANNNIKAITAMARKAGFKNHSHSAIIDVLKNPVYAGLVKVNKYYDEEEKLVKGIHEPIISVEDYWKAQELLFPRKATRTVLSDDFPLRGKLLCRCGKMLTGAKSKGRKQYVPYYKCNYHNCANYNANVVHDQMLRILDILSLPQNYIDEITNRVQELFDQEYKHVRKQTTIMKKELGEKQAMLSKLEDEYLASRVDHETYTRKLPQYRAEVRNLKDKISNMLAPTDADELIMDVKRLANLATVYQHTNTETKQAMVGWVFDNKLQYSDKVYRTTFLQNLFSVKYSELESSGLIVFDQDPLNSVKFGDVPRIGDVSNQVFELARIISGRKSA